MLGFWGWIGVVEQLKSLHPVKFPEPKCFLDRVGPQTETN